MNMRELFDTCSFGCSRVVLGKYSTSFSLASSLLRADVRQAICSIYGFVRLADEIVDSFHDLDQRTLLKELEREVGTSIERGISLNPLLNSFQLVVNQYRIEAELISSFLESMRADLTQRTHTRETFDTYVYGSAEVVGLMCLRVFVNGDDGLYRELAPSARALGSAFQQVNFLRDMHFDSETLGRSYYSDLDPKDPSFSRIDNISEEISLLFCLSLEGIKKLPGSSRFGVYLAYRYFNFLFKKIRRCSYKRVFEDRIRIRNDVKIVLLLRSWVRYQLNML